MTECSDILRWKVPYNFEQEFYQIASALVHERVTEIKAMLIYTCLSKFFHLLLEDQEFTNGVQKKVCNTIVRNFWYFVLQKTHGVTSRWFRQSYQQILLLGIYQCKHFSIDENKIESYNFVIIILIILWLQSSMWLCHFLNSNHTGFLASHPSH